MDKGKIYIYGDSLMKATVPDEAMRYKFTFADFLVRLPEGAPEIVNRSYFGATAAKGVSVLKRDIEKGFDGAAALIEFGGNDCNYDWAQVAAAPDAEHLPKTELSAFEDMMCGMAEAVRAEGAKPVMMTLPPIDAEKYLAFLSAKGGLSRENIIRWLGDVNMIYRFHELYSDTVRALAAKLGILCIDVRSAFLTRHDFGSLISADGIHPTSAGYGLVFDALKSALA